MSVAISRNLKAALLAGSLITAPFALASPAQASEADSIARIVAQIAAQNARIADQEEQLAGQKALLESQGAEIRALRRQRDMILDEIRAGHGVASSPETVAPPATRLAAGQSQPGGLPTSPVGEAPAQPQRKLQEVAAIPQRLGVLTPKGVLVGEPDFEFTHSSANRLVFRGVEIVPGIQLGVIDATDADRNAVVGTAVARYGVTDRLEVEGRVPYLYRNDRVTTVEQRDASITRTSDLYAQDIGDVEFDARYQINRAVAGQPVYVGYLRLKPPTGKSPYDVGYDQFGVATGLATGSGFWGTELGMTMLYPTDPAVIYGGLSYLYNAARGINKDIGSAHVGRVDPGDSITAGIGFGLALNQRFSFSLGYSHAFIFPTKSEIGGVDFNSNSLQIGTLQMGLSFRLTDRLSLINSFDFGVTSDAPDMHVSVRLPYRF